MGKKILNGRLHWWIKNGYNIRVWEDKWISIPHPWGLLTSCPNNTIISMVSDLMILHTTMWNIMLIYSLFFLPCEGNAILSLPLSRHIYLNRSMWACEYNGVCLVRTWYQFGLPLWCFFSMRFFPSMSYFELEV